MTGERGHEIAQLLAILEMGLSYLQAHPTRQGEDVEETLRECREANAKLGAWIRTRLIEQAT